MYCYYYHISFVRLTANYWVDLSGNLVIKTGTALMKDTVNKINKFVSGAV